MKQSYKSTTIACFTGYIVQAIVNNFIPLLFVTFHVKYALPLSQITLLITLNFAIQLFVDLASVTFVDRLGYRASMVLAHAASALGLICLAILPNVLAKPLTGIIISVVLYAIGGGLLEVLVSPVMEACPTPNKEAAMSLLHSFYCWGHVGVVLLSTLFFAVFGIDRWPLLAILWSVVPLANMLVFTKVPMASLIQEGETGFTLKELFSTKLFWILLLLMICAGASEQAVSQWASTFAEQCLGISKTIGDLAGPMMFAITMGIARMIYGKFADRIPLKRFIVFSALLCIGSYLLISLSPLPMVSLIGCGICGFSVGILWPGTFSMASSAIPRGGTALFALLALGGDVGCSGGPTFVGLISDALGGDLHRGILCAILFPILMLLGVGMFHRLNTHSK